MFISSKNDLKGWNSSVVNEVPCDNQLCQVLIGRLSPRFLASSGVSFWRRFRSVGLGKRMTLARSRTLSDSDFVVSSWFIVPAHKTLRPSGSW